MIAHQPTAERFIELLTGDKSTPVHVRLIADKEGDERFPHKLFGSIAELWPEIEAAAPDGRGAFVVVNEGGNDAKDITNVRALFIDMDGKPLAGTEWHDRPDWVVQRDDTHWHAYWKMDDWACPTDEFRRAQKRLIARYGADPRIHDLPRVLRLPGTLHVKGAPVQVKLLAGAQRPPRPLADVMAGLPDVSLQSEVSKPSSYTGPLDLPANVARGKNAVMLDGDDEWHNGDAYNIASRLVRDFALSVETAAELIAARWNPDRNPEWDTDILRTVAHAAQYGTNAFGCDAVSPAEAIWSAEVLDKLAASKPRRAGPRVKLFTIQDIFAFPDPEFLVEGLLVEGENIILAGQMKTGKTFITLEIAMCLTHNLPVFGTQKLSRHGPVVYLTSEGGASFRPRVMAWRNAHRIAPEVEAPFFLSDTVPMTSAGIEDNLDFLDDVIAQVGHPILVIIDTLARATMDMKEDNEAGSRYLAMTEAIRDRVKVWGGAVMTVGHFGKTAAQGLRGHTTAAAGVDANWQTELNEDGGRKVFKLATTNSRNLGALGPYYFGLKHVATNTKLDNGAVLEVVAPHFFEGAKVDDPLSGPAIGAALVAHNITSPGVSTERLAKWLRPAREGEAQEAYLADLGTTERKLQARARSNLAAYVIGQAPLAWGMGGDQSQG